MAMTKRAMRARMRRWEAADWEGAARGQLVNDLAVAHWRDTRHCGADTPKLAELWRKWDAEAEALSFRALLLRVKDDYGFRQRYSADIPRAAAAAEALRRLAANDEAANGEVERQALAARRELEYEDRMMAA